MVTPPELDKKIPLLQTLYTLTVRSKGVKLELRQKLPPCWLAVTVPEDTSRLLRETRHPQSDPAVNPANTVASRQQDTCSCAILVTTVTGVTNPSLIGFEATGGNLRFLLDL